MDAGCAGLWHPCRGLGNIDGRDAAKIIGGRDAANETMARQAMSSLRSGLLICDALVVFGVYDVHSRLDSRTSVKIANRPAGKIGSAV